MRVKELIGAERRIAALEIEQFYPRKITDTELNDAWWFSYGPGWFWLWPTEDGDELILHACRPSGGPATGGYGREWMYCVKMLGQLLGFKRLRFPGADDEKVASYIQRWGWTPDAHGYFLDLGD
jgi:hypothetical protein